ncbi:hypothetical protein [Marinobacterium aestuariivivens]|uniref:HIRAN domain-containing protein n=1 Tax=Marinobacterium aestuariivivens TaxID=1698799 RepID=A0ABW2A4H8_9GAMM
MSRQNIFIAVLGVATIGLVITEVSMSGGTVSRTESALFSVLQFVFSLSFAWYLSKEASQEDFEERQRKFAISAFRRIKEVEVQINHLLKRLEQAKRGEESEQLHGLDIASVMAQSIQKTAQSSKLDWADVIGDQIESLEQIEELQDIEVDEEPEDTGMDSASTQLSEKIEELKNSLSSELKLYASERGRPRPRMQFAQRLTKDGYLTLRGFADTDWDGLRDPNKLSVGEAITVKLGDHRNRVATLCVYDDDGHYVGSFINSSSAPYGEFSTAVCQAMGSCTFAGEIVEVEQKKSDSKRTYFAVKCFPVSEVASSE